MEHVDHILIVDDDREIRELVGNYLKKNGLRTTVVADGRQMRSFLEANTVDLIVLDIMMPGDDGLQLCRELRVGKHKATPVLMLTARNDETDRIIGLEMGADDYLTKPFAARELLARINAVLRRTRMLPPNLVVTEAGRLLAFGRWQLDTSARHLLDKDGTMVALSGAEYRLLRVFLDHPQRVLSRDQLLNLTQGRDADLFDRSIDLLVSRLRQRLLDDAREPAYIKTVRSEGYVFSCRLNCSGRRHEFQAAMAAHPRLASVADFPDRADSGPGSVVRRAVLRALPERQKHHARQSRNRCCDLDGDPRSLARRRARGLAAAPGAA